MTVSRRQLVSLAIGGAGWLASRRSALASLVQASSDSERRVARVVHEYGEQGDHRTGTLVDNQSAEWLSLQVRKVGLLPIPESFAINRVVPVRCELTIDGRRVEGLPLFDGAFTDASGVRGRVGALGSESEIGIVTIAPNAAGAEALGEARRKNLHRAIIAVTRGGIPGLTPSNADAFLRPYGPPVLQVASTEADWLAESAARSATADVVAQVDRTNANAVNVTARIDGSQASLPPLIIMTPRSGWYSCASERGGGIACWLELMRSLRAARPVRDVIFVASTGHELGHLGIDHYIAQRPGIVSRAIGWIHLGASIGAAMTPRYRLQASDDAVETSFAAHLAAAGLRIDQRLTRGSTPAGEAEAVHRGGGRFVSVVGTSACFHHPADRGPDVVSVSAVVQFAGAFGALARQLASQ